MKECLRCGGSRLRDYAWGCEHVFTEGELAAEHAPKTVSYVWSWAQNQGPAAPTWVTVGPSALGPGATIRFPGDTTKAEYLIVATQWPSPSECWVTADSCGARHTFVLKSHNLVERASFSSPGPTWVPATLGALSVGDTVRFKRSPASGPRPVYAINSIDRRPSDGHIGLEDPANPGPAWRRYAGASDLEVLRP